MKEKEIFPEAGSSLTSRVHIESLLLMAKYDDEFREELLASREESLKKSGIPFAAAEIVLLSGIGREKLERTINEFAVPGITQKSLPGWRTAAGVIMLLTSVLFAGPVCRTAGTSGQVESGDVMRSEGWIDENTFRASAVGMPNRGVVNITQKKATAKRAATMMAQKRVIERFIGSRIEGAAGMAEYDSPAPAIVKEFGGIVKSGKVIKETYDNEYNCEIIYEVKSPGLRKRLQNF
ncbi:MAG: hypothetical protein GY754_45500 [bacterium]|nr:hypothetical protein [bacterium]